MVLNHTNLMVVECLSEKTIPDVAAECVVSGGQSEAHINFCHADRAKILEKVNSFLRIIRKK